MATQYIQIDTGRFPIDDSALRINASGALTLAYDTVESLAPVRVYNDTVGTIPDGALLNISGTYVPAGATRVSTVRLADATAADQLEACLIADGAISPSAYGEAKLRKRITLMPSTGAALNFGGSTVGDPVFLSGTAGDYTTTAPTGATSLQQIVGYVDVATATGSLIASLPTGTLTAHTHQDASRGGLLTLANAVADDDITTAVINAKVNNSAFATAHFSGAEIKFAAGALDAAGAASFVANDAITAGFWEAKAAAGAISATADGRASLADDFFTAAEFVAGAGGKFAPDCMDATALANVVANDAITAGVWEAKAAAGAISATVDGRASLADDFFTTAEMVSGAGGKFATGCFDATGVANVFADGSFPSPKLDGTAYGAGTTINTPVYSITRQFDATGVDFDVNADVQVLAGNDHAALYVVAVQCMITTAEGAADAMALFTGANGAGTRVSGDMLSNSIGLNNEGANIPAAADRALAAATPLYLHGAAAITAAIGTIIIWCRNNA